MLELSKDLKKRVEALYNSNDAMFVPPPGREYQVPEKDKTMDKGDPYKAAGTSSGSPSASQSRSATPPPG